MQRIVTDIRKDRNLVVDVFVMLIKQRDVQVLDVMKEKDDIRREMFKILRDRHLSADAIDRLIVIRTRLNEINEIIFSIPEGKIDCRLTKDERQRVRDMYRSGNYTQGQLAYAFRVSQSAISQIVKGVRKPLNEKVGKDEFIHRSIKRTRKITVEHP